jgi:hypothetical protein
MNDERTAKKPLEAALHDPLLIIVIIPLAVGRGLAWQRFGGDVPVDYESPTEHFKYGSTGGEHEMGFPYWIWRALPEVCPQYLPGKGYQSLGMVFEKNADGSDRDVPVGTSQRRYQGIDRVFVNCAVCHTSTVRTAADQPPTIVLGMPAATFNMKGFEEFFFRCAADPKFSKEYILPEIERQGGQLDLLDRYSSIRWPSPSCATACWRSPGASTGSSNSTNGARAASTPSTRRKVIFNFPMAHLDPGVRRPGRLPVALAAAPAQGAARDAVALGRQQHHRRGAQQERRLRHRHDAADHRHRAHQLASRTGSWTSRRRAFDQFFPVDAKLARGRADLPGLLRPATAPRAATSAASMVGKVTPLAEIGTDRRRLDSYTYTLAVNQATLYAGYPVALHAFPEDARLRQHAARRPLAARALPAQRLGAQPARPARTGGGTAAGLLSRQRRLRPGQGRLRLRPGAGRTAGRFSASTPRSRQRQRRPRRRAYGTELSADEKTALVEFLKTF